MVVGCANVRETKAALKAAPFPLRAGTPRTEGKIPVSYQKIAREIAFWHAAPLGDIFRVLIPEIFTREKFPARLARGAGARRFFIEKPYQKRVEEYKKIISQAGEGCVLLVAPTAVEARRLAQEWGGTVLTGEQSARQKTRALREARGARLVVTTPAYSFLPLEKIKAVIIERESAAGYERLTAPFLDWRIALRFLAQERRIKIVEGDYPLRLETRRVAGAALAYSPDHSLEVVSLARDKQKRNAPPPEPFSAVPPSLLKVLAETMAREGRAFVCAMRRGYAPAVVCRDCGATVRDAQGRTLSLATLNKKRVFRTADGAVIRDARTVCDVCGSWNLLPLGVGVERVMEELTRALPHTRILRFDADTIKTPAAARRAAAGFPHPRTIIVGTPMAIPWIDPRAPIDFAAIASADSLLALPFWRARERFIRLAFALAERSERTLVVTRRPDDTTVKTLLAPRSNEFFKEEDSLRALVGYPPHGHILTIRVRGTPSTLEKDEKLIRSVSPSPLIRLPDRLARGTKKTLRLRTLILKRGPQAWPERDISRALAALSPRVSVEINPESLW